MNWMKLNKVERRLFYLCCLIILVFSYLLYDDSLLFSSRDTKDSPIAELIEKKKDVRIKMSDSFSWMPARSTEKLFPFDSIFTGDGSVAMLKLSDGSTLKVDSQSLIVMSMYQGQLVLDLKSGSLSGDLKQNSKLLLKTKEGFQSLNGDQGKKFRFERDFAGHTLQRIDRKPSAVTDSQLIWKSPRNFTLNKADPRTYQNLSWVKTGEVEDTIIEISTTSEFELIDKQMRTTKTESGIPIELPDGQYFVRLKGYNKERKLVATSLVHSFNLFEKKRSLLPPPLLLTKNIAHLDSYNFPPIVKWVTVADATKYKIEVSNSPRFEQVKSYESALDTFAWSDFQPGTYFVRLYSQNSDSISEPSDIGTIEVSSLAPQLDPIPRLLIRSADKNIGPQNVKLLWRHTGKQAKYRVEISKDGSFRDAQVLETTRGPASMQVKNPGDYAIRVFAANEDGTPISPSSNVEHFRYDLRSPLETPQLIKPFSETTVFLQKEDNPYLWLDWKTVPDADIFQVQISRDPEFKNIIWTEKTDRNRFLVEKRIPNGQYYWRVKAVADKGETDSDWSPANRFYLVFKKKDIFFE
jgi:hypothetical protein